MESLSTRTRIKNITDQKKRKKVEEILNPLILDDVAIKKIMDAFEGQISLANTMNPEEREKSNLLWECTYVRNLLKGNENGDYIGLDLGGTNFRVVRVVMKNGVANTTTKYYNLDENLLSGPCIHVFDHIAESLEKFLREENIETTNALPVGFTFSFPSDQRTLKHSVLITWTKSFKCPDGPGLDACVLLEEAIARRKKSMPVELDVMARISDTTGALMAGNYVDKNCRIGVILGTGSNACFVERLENYNKFESSDPNTKQILVNVEWGAFGDNGCLDFCRNEYEKEVDLYSNHPHSYTFEKRFGGLYLGEQVRLPLVKLIEEGCLFNGKSSPELMKRWGFATANVTSIEEDTETSERTWSVLRDFHLADMATEEDVSLVREVCAIESERGSKIVAAVLAVLLNHINLPEVTIAFDGSLYERHPKYSFHIADLLAKLVPTTQTKLILVKDGSGQGAAFVAAVEYEQP
ncbi:hexokinase-1-like [Ostrea edulis]|uniref:hexokinase-1-like n=1 Tax=Ostrea edulis TaxID=37623 RepID=UPI0020958FE4|nr:hexokinase-1-like [Ostrea edulis]